MKAINGSALECAIINAHHALDTAGYIADIIQRDILPRTTIKQSVKDALKKLIEQQQVTRERYITSVEHIYY